MSRSRRVGIISLIVLSLMSIILLLSWLYYVALYPVKYFDEADLFAHKYNLDTELVMAVINAESGFDVDAQSSKGALGLMQIMPDTAHYLSGMLGIKDFETKSLVDPATNIELGCYYLRYLLDKFGSVPVAVTAYNAGEGVVTNWLNDSRYSIDGKCLNSIPYQETKKYTAKVIESIDVYQSRLASKHR